MKPSTSKQESSDLLLRLQSVIDTAIDGIITINARGIVESMNPAAAKLFDYKAEEVIGKNISMLMPEPHQTHHDGYLHNYHTTGQARIIGVGREIEGLRKDGTTFPCRLAISQVELKGKRIYTGIIHDLSSVKAAEDEVLRMNRELERKVRSRTEQLAQSVEQLVSTNQRLEHEIKERKLAEAALRKSLDKEKELNELKSRFVSMASHEFRTPLSSILSSAELIKEYKQEDQQPRREKHVNRILSSVENLTGILNDFLSLSKLEEGAVQSQLETFSISAFCQKVLDEFQGTLKPGQQVDLHGNISQDTVVLDRKFLKNIFFNLLSNASKYSDEGARIDCTVVTQDQQLLIQNADQGIGIPTEERQYLFTRFFRAHNAENIKGTGLGLHIVKRYLDLMEGTIDFTSEPGVGTTFFVTIPLKTAL